MFDVGVDLAGGEKSPTGLAAVDQDGHLLAGNLCIGVETFPDYQARRMIDLLLAGLAQPAPAPTGSQPT